jgi:hypothetical protein
MMMMHMPATQAVSGANVEGDSERPPDAISAQVGYGVSGVTRGRLD